MELARYISPQSIMRLGLKMEFIKTEIEQIEFKINNQNDKRRAIFDIINDWCDKSIEVGVALDELTQKLLNILEQCECAGAAALLKDFGMKIDEQNSNANCRFTSENGESEIERPTGL